MATEADPTNHNPWQDPDVQRVNEAFLGILEGGEITDESLAVSPDTVRYLNELKKRRTGEAALNGTEE